MQNIQDLKEKIFFEAMSIIDNLDKISNIDKLLSKQDLVDELANRISFLKLLEKNIEYFISDTQIQNQEKQCISFISGETEHHDSKSEITEEEAVFNNQLNEIDEQEEENREPKSLKGANYAEVNDIKKPEEEKIISSILDFEEQEDKVLIKENEERCIAPNISIEQGEKTTKTSNVENILEEIKKDHSEEEIQETGILDEIYDHKKAVEIDKPVCNEINEDCSDESFENLEEYHQHKKIKLANIKGIKAVQSIIISHSKKERTKQENSVSEAKEDAENILKSDISTSSEAGKLNPDIKLDLNDKLAFTKILFNGSQAELNDTISQLNQFKTLDEAKEYLSDLYYEKKWKKVDEYAQRLWILVENKFL